MYFQKKIVLDYYSSQITRYDFLNLNRVEKNMNQIENAKVGYVMPSLGKNLIWLQKAIHSIQQQDHETDLVIVIPKTIPEFEAWLIRQRVKFIYESKPNLTNAINSGVQYFLDAGIEYFAFLGDDDILLPSSTRSLMTAFQQENVVSSVGHCWYIDETEKVVFHNRAWPKLITFMRIIPNVIPHPGAIMKTETWKKIGGFDENLHFAMDLDYWLKLRKYGKIVRVECPMSLFRWHSNGLTASNRESSMAEAISVRRKHSTGFFLILNAIFAPLMTYLGERVLLKNAARYQK